MAALAGSRVPVPGTIGAEPEPDVLGAPFFVMEHVAGAVLRTPTASEQNLTSSQRLRLGYDLVETLAELHTPTPTQWGWVTWGAATAM